MELLFYILSGLIAVSPLIAGIILKIRPPKKINCWYGFRTEISASSQEAWDYAHKICAKLLLICSIVEMSVYASCFIVCYLFLHGYEWIYMLIALVLVIVVFIIVYATVQIKTQRFIKDLQNQRS